MTVLKSLAVSTLTLALAAPALAQQVSPGQGQAPSAEDQVNQLDELVDLDDNQQQELVTLLNDSQSRIQSLQGEAQQVQVQLQENIGPEFDETAIRQDAERLGQLTGDMTAESVLMQARVEATLTQEQRDELQRQMEAQQEQMRQMQEQMQQQQQQPQ
ncbi:periplasmic heavy metal sensor [Halomonas kalidii]|uniref:Signaling pathway modulator ZraP n=1 Tax=Halomonas kalidii TaxID=3043293 RepID=A0ABT6VK36_9GAMM|nr:periplasmic heavy metal sensor [Halomonas kalidii]MDI5933111.1 periplasmic heavy metal sensor [Halomonas kalidii]